MDIAVNICTTICMILFAAEERNERSLEKIKKEMKNTVSWVITVKWHVSLFEQSEKKGGKDKKQELVASQTSPSNSAYFLHSRSPSIHL